MKIKLDFCVMCGSFVYDRKAHTKATDHRGFGYHEIKVTGTRSVSSSKKE